MKKSIEKTLREEALHSLGIEPPSLEEIHRKAEMSPKNPTSAKKNVWAYLSPVVGALGGAAVALAIALPLTMANASSSEVGYGGGVPFEQAFYGTYNFEYVSFSDSEFSSPIKEETKIVFASSLVDGPGVLAVPSKGDFEGAFRFENTPLSAIEFNDPFIIDDYAIETTYVSEEGEIAMTVEAKRLNSYSTIRVRFYDEDDYSLLDVTFGLQQ